ncbi:MAG: hypothetical protein NDP24_02160 [Crenarchaeota archaeon]|nr:hypothetical protein [Thermoproteota archaeon]
MDLSRKTLYSNTFCAYRDKYLNRTLCRHPCSYGECDLDLCPIVNDHFANVIFQEDGVYLVVKTPSEEYVAGTWEKTKLDISPELTNEENVIRLALEKAKNTHEKIRMALQRRIRGIYARMRFLKERGKPVGILAPVPPSTPAPELALEETLKEEIEMLERKEKEEAKIEEEISELEKELEKIE